MGRVASQLAIITALLYYFGWARTQAIFSYFGLNVGSLDLSTADYVLRSVAVAFLPCATLALLGLLGVALHDRFVVPILKRVSRAEKVSRYVRWARWSAGLLLLVVTIGVLFPSAIPRFVSDIGLASVLVVAISILAYGEYISARYLGYLSNGKDESRLFRRLALAALAFIGVLWFLSLYAGQTGAATATAILNGTEGSPMVVLFSEDSLAIAGPGVQSAPILAPGSRYRFTYSGLRLLTRANGKVFLLPVGWTKGRDTLFSIPDDARIRLDIFDR